VVHCLTGIVTCAHIKDYLPQWAPFLRRLIPNSLAIHRRVFSWTARTTAGRQEGAIAAKAKTTNVSRFGWRVAWRKPADPDFSSRRWL
jgi:hypothetical protein